MVKNILLLMVILLTLASCGSKKGTSSVNLKIIGGNAIGGGSSFDGGIVLYGKSEDGKSSFRTGLESSSGVISMNLPKGRWDFYIMTWEGDNGIFTGVNRCGYTNVDLKSDEMNVAFDLATINCVQVHKGKEFVATGYSDANGIFNSFKLAMCMNNTPESADCYVNLNKSRIHSYKVVFRGDKKGDVGGNVDPLVSACQSVASYPYFLKLPFTNAGNDTPFGVAFALYKDASCSGIPDVGFDFSNGLIDSPVSAFNTTDKIVGSYSYFYLNPGERFNPTLPAEAIDFNLIDLTTTSVGLATDNPLIDFTTTVPTHATEMCVLVVGAGGACTAADWIPASNYGRVSLSGYGDGGYTLQISFRTAAEIQSTNPLDANFILDTTAPVAPTLNSTISSGIFNASWNADSSLFKRVYYDLCTDSSCSTIKYSNNETTASGSLSKNLGSYSIMIGMTPCVRVKTEDELGRFSPYSTTCTTYAP